MDDEEDVLQELKTKIEEFFKKGNVLTKREDLDKFLEAIDLLDVWSNEEEKELVWQCLNKYNKKGIIDYNATINGIRDLLNQDEGQQQQIPQNESHETILKHLSRRASMRVSQKKRISIIKLKQFALDEYECVDNDILIQLKKIFNLLKIDKNNCKLVYNQVKEICAKNKFIKITPEEVWKYLSFMSADNNEGALFKPMNIHLTLYTEIEHFINEKIKDEDSDDSEDDDDEENEKNGKKEDKEEEPLNIIDNLINKSNNIQEKSQEFADMINNLTNLTNTMVEKAQNILEGNDSTLEDVLFVKDLMIKKINEISSHNKSLVKQQNANNEKIEKIQFYINKLNEEKKSLEDDYKQLNDKYENQQKDENYDNEEAQRLFSENIMLSQENEAKEKEIKELNEKNKELENKYNNTFGQLENALNKNQEMKLELNDLKVKNMKFKTDYSETLEKLISLEKKYNQELLNKEQQQKPKEEEDTKKEEDILALFAKKQGIQNPNFMANKRRSQLIVLPKNIQIEEETNEEKLTKYIKELEKMNEILKERNKDNAMKVKELEDLFSKNSNGNNIIETQSDPNKLLKLNEIFHPSMYEIFNERICLISDLSNYNPKKNFIVKKWSFIVGEPKIKKKEKKEKKVHFKKEIILIKQKLSEVNYKGIIKEEKKQNTFDIKLINISSNSSFNIKAIPKKPIEVKVEKPPKPIIKLSKSNFNINILRPMKKVIKFEKVHTEFNLISNNINNINNNKNIIKELKKENCIEIYIQPKLSIGKKRNELLEDSKKINLLFNDDSNTITTNKNKKFEISKINDENDEDENKMLNKIRSGTIMINPKELFDSKDYYCLFQEDYVKRKLNYLKDTCSEKYIYSDQIYVLVEKKLLAKKYILLSPKHFCILDLNLKFVYIDEIKNIKNIVLSNKNLNMILFRFNDGEDLLIESLRTYDLLSFMKNNYYSNIKDTDSKFKYENRFIIKIKTQLHTISVTDKILTNIINFDGALKVGFLSFYKAKFISSIFTETIGVLIDVGLLLIEEASFKPLALIPIIGSTITKVEKERFGNNHCFEITTANGITRVFDAHKHRERESWIVQFKKMQKDYKEKIKKLGAIEKSIKSNEGNIIKKLNK